MVKLFSAIGLFAAVCLVASCSKKQNYGGTAVQKVANSWWVLAYSSKSGLLTFPPPAKYDTSSNHFLVFTYNTSANSSDSIWVDNTYALSGDWYAGPGGPGPWGYDFTATVGVNLANYSFASNGAANTALKDTMIASLVPPFTVDSAVQINNPISWMRGEIFPKGGKSRSGASVVDSIFLQFLFANNPGDTLTVKGVARTAFDQDDWPVGIYAPAP